MANRFYGFGLDTLEFKTLVNTIVRYKTLMEEEQQVTAVPVRTSLPDINNFYPYNFIEKKTIDNNSDYVASSVSKQITYFSNIKFFNINSRLNFKKMHASFLVHFVHSIDASIVKIFVNDFDTAVKVPCTTVHDSFGVTYDNFIKAQFIIRNAYIKLGFMNPQKIVVNSIINPNFDPIIFSKLEEKKHFKIYGKILKQSLIMKLYEIVPPANNLLVNNLGKF